LGALGILNSNFKKTIDEILMTTPNLIEMIASYRLIAVRNISHMAGPSPLKDQIIPNGA
jgi:hypothetical protein